MLVLIHLFQLVVGMVEEMVLAVGLVIIVKVMELLVEVEELLM